MTETNYPGLTSRSRDQWPETITVPEDGSVIDQLIPNSDVHERIKNHLIERIRYSEREMSPMYARWATAEQKVQGYINLPDWEKDLKAANDAGDAPTAVRITVPYAFGTISTIVAFLMHTFTGRRPMFQVGSNKQEAVEGAKSMELVLQYNADHARMVRHLFQFFTDAETYGVSILRVSWETIRKMRTVRKRLPKAPSLLNSLGFGAPEMQEQVLREEHLVYSGNDVTSQDPFMFFPDPRVPMADVAKRGEWVFWRSYEGMHSLKKLEVSGEFKWVENAGHMLPRNFQDSESSRALVSLGRPNPGQEIYASTGGAAGNAGASQGRSFVQVDQGTIDIIPKELGLSPSERVEKWIFTILNKKQIVQAEKLEDDHGKHPVVVAEPYSLGYGFGHPSMADYLGPIQDIISWYINSHIDNVRRVLNDIVIVDPSAIELQDLKNPSPGAIIRLKRAAHGRDVRTIIQQMPIQDVTSGHMRDAELMMHVGERLSAVTDQLSGASRSGKSSRRTATEVRTEAEGGLSRLASHAKLYSAMAIVDLTEMMSLNVQQYMDEEFFLELMGSDGARDHVVITPEMLVGDFHYPIHDGTLPLDRVALFDVWSQIFAQVQQDPQLRTNYDIGKIFEYISELGGARNIESFKINIRPDQQVQQGIQDGNNIPLNGAGIASLANGGGGAINPQNIL